MTATAPRIPFLPVLAVGAFAIGTDTFVVAGVLPEVADNLNVGIDQAGWISTVFALTYAVLAPVLGALTGRVDRRTLLVVSLLGFAVGNALSALAPNLGLLLLARVATAASAALYIPAASAGAAALSAPERRARAMAVVLGGLSAATVAGVPFGTWLAADIDWRATFWLLAGLGALCAAAVGYGLPKVQLPPSPGLKARLAPARDPRVAATVATTLLFMTGGYLALTYIGAVLAPATDGNGSTLALLLLGFGVAAVAGTTLAGRAVDRWSPSPVLLVSIALLGLAVVTLPLTRDGLGTAAVALAVWGLAGMATQPPQQHRLFGIAPQSGPLLISLNSAATFAGIALGGFLGRTVLRAADSSEQGLDRLGLFGGGLIAVSLLVALVATRLPAPAPAAAPAAPAPAPAAVAD
ncbi:MFS transporter [Kitasatospora sp. NPDC002040]|uniref:MFS transporter n=1 Tax=Kitasatospora sp. NPDC002040 TaxID=3154661 RepID=UPI003326BABC